MISLYCLIGMFIVVAKCIFWIVAIRKYEIRLSNDGFLVAIVSLILDLFIWPINLIAGVITTYSKTINKMMDFMYDD